MKPSLRTLLYITIFILGLLLSVLSYILLYWIATLLSLHGAALQIAHYTAALFSVVLPVIYAYLLVKSILGPTFGLNPGRRFHDWIRDIMDIAQVHTTQTLLTDRLRDVTLYDAEGNPDTGHRRMVLITSNLTYDRIVKFPEKARDYWSDAAMVHPAEYVRATMSIPFFFSVYTPLATAAARVIQPSRFVDGGMLSNFPIREFHSATTPRYPTFGIKLGVEERHRFTADESLRSYILSFISTFRSFYDNEFLAEDPEASQLIAPIKTGNANWLNFWMQSDEQKQLFQNGAEAACTFLAGFDWEKYKTYRMPKERSSSLPDK